MFGLGESETLVILLAILVLFGAKRIPDVAKSLGSGIREFRRAMREIQDEVTTAATLEPTAKQDTPAVASATPPAGTAAPTLPPPEQSVPRTPPTGAPGA